MSEKKSNAAPKDRRPFFVLERWRRRRCGRRAEACSCLPLTRGPCPQGVQVIRLVSQAGTGYFYTKLKNFKAGVEKLQLLKFDPVVNKRVLFKEERIKK